MMMFRTSRLVGYVNHHARYPGAFGASHFASPPLSCGASGQPKKPVVFFVAVLEFGQPFFFGGRLVITLQGMDTYPTKREKEIIDSNMPFLEDMLVSWRVVTFTWFIVIYLMNLSWFGIGFLPLRNYLPKNILLVVNCAKPERPTNHWFQPLRKGQIPKHWTNTFRLKGPWQDGFCT